jgi:hypothetical protein
MLKKKWNKQKLIQKEDEEWVVTEEIQKEVDMDLQYDIDFGKLCIDDDESDEESM